MAAVSSFSRRQHEILDALTRVVLADGFDHLTVGDLAERLHCSRRTLYTLAPSRDDLVRGVIQEWLHGWTRRAREAAAEARDPLASVVEFLSAGLGIAEASPRFLDDVAAHPETATLYASTIGDYVRELAGLIEAARPSNGGAIDAAISAEVLHAAAARVGTLVVREQRISMEDARTVVDGLVRGWFDRASRAPVRQVS